MTEPDDVRTTRKAYDLIAAEYAEMVRDEIRDNPFERAMLGTFAELIQAAGGGPVAEVGCGPGRVTDHLNSLGLDVFGVDLSPAMVDLARKLYPDLRFDVGSMTDLDVSDGTLTGLVAWYSIIHPLPQRLPAVFAEFHRVLAPGGHLLVAFQVGDEPLHIAEAFGHKISLDFHRLNPDRIAEQLTRTGFTIQARLVREPRRTEKVPQAYLLAQKP
ncbi:class I SAM-dependent DNA methyltransferase [Rhizohabitans arisaemae]|uniref:class I SAM-dependent DNA methyltransferase n=1 Tax=Rhizohabitans arisaemae TaxID=2720610 RepID=UPI0024B14840|nr:class I SAM-dependent methyltransferase [Rhizohabitans arisaemae]